LQEDQAALETRVAQSKLRDAIEGDQLAAAQKQIDLLLARATGAERSDLENLKARIARRQAGGARLHRGDGVGKGDIARRHRPLHGGAVGTAKFRQQA